MIHADVLPIPNIAFFFSDSGVFDYGDVDIARISRDFKGFKVNGESPIGCSANGGPYIELSYPSPVTNECFWEVIPELCSVQFDDGKVHPIIAGSGLVTPL